MIKSYLKTQKIRFFVFSLVAFYGFQHSNHSFASLSVGKKRFPTHQILPKTLSISQEKKVLLVGLESYLGREVINNQSSPYLRLSGNKKSLILKDSNGVFHKSKEINIGWRSQPLEHPKKFVRQIIGPFASFESAERVSNDLKNKRIKSTIAHPKDWEIWLSEEVKIPKSIKSTFQKIKVVKTVEPFLDVKIGKIALEGPITIHAPDGLNWKNGIYSGPFSIQLDAYGSWTLVEHVPLERYLLGVVPHEIGSNSPPSALAAQAVLARTWAIANSHRFDIDGYNLCSDSQCQVYKDPSKTSENIKNAILKTNGKILTWDKKPISAVYHATNGGVMASYDEAWSTTSVPYLKMRLDGPASWSGEVKLPLSNENNLQSFLLADPKAFGFDHSLFRWTRVFNSSQLAAQLRVAKKVSGPFHPKIIKVLKRGPSGRVIILKIVGKTGSQLLLRLDEIRRVFRQLPSTLFVVNEVKEGQWHFSGGGFGHGVGMSQSGAIELGRNGWTTEQILSHYYPKTKYEFLP